MRRFLLTAAAAACTVGFAIADDNKPKGQSVAATRIIPKVNDDDKKDEKKDGEKKDLTRKERLAELKKEINKKRSDLAKEINANKEPAERNKLIEQYQNAGASGAKKMLDLAKEDIKDEASIEAALASMQFAGPGKTSKDASEFLLDNFADDSKISIAIPMLANMDASLVNKLVEKTKNKDVRGTALFTIADAEVDKIDYPPTGKPLPAEEANAKYAAVASELSKLGVEYNEVKIQNRNGKTIGEAAKKKLYFVNNLTVGKKAPDFECELLDDKKAKLSDYKGNVVVLDVWATWCGPCKAMIPHERELVEKMKSKPFKLVSLSADEKKETLTKFLEKEEMPWNHMWNGAKGGFVEQYQIRFYPTIYVLDAKGTIRYKHVRGPKMDEAVETLLKEMSGAE